MNRKTILLLFFIFLLGALLRFYRLGEVPVGLHTDEAYLGYNAYSILKTGREITGDFLPIHLRSFLFSPAGYTYSSIPFIAVFGLSSFSVRFSSALFGSFTIILTFILALKLFDKYKYKEYIALAASFFLAISPWHINLSRTATDNVLVVFFITLGVILYLLWLERKKYFLVLLSILSFGVTIYIYQAPRSFLPLFILLLFLVFAKKIIDKKNIVILLGYLLLIILPVLLILKSPELSFRIKTLSIFQNPQTQLVLNEQLREDGVSGISPVMARLFNNKVVNYSMTFSNIYFKHFSYDFLFTDSGYPDRYRVPGMGLLYFFEFPLIIFGLWMLFNSNKKLGVFLVGWVLLAPVGSALTFDDVPNLQRTLFVFPALSMIASMGFIGFIDFMRKNIRNLLILRILFVLISFVILYNFFYYIQAYYVHQVVHRPWYRQEGYQKLVTELNKNASKYPKSVITDAELNPTIFLLFYNKYDPAAIQKVISESKTADYGDISFSKYEITKEQCPVREEVLTNLKTGENYFKITGKKGILYVDDGVCKIPQGANLISEIKRSDGTLVFKLVSLK